jgi:hypothetical protein
MQLIGIGLRYLCAYCNGTGTFWIVNSVTFTPEEVGCPKCQSMIYTTVLCGLTSFPWPSC